MADFNDPAYSPAFPAQLLRQSLLDQQAMRVQNTQVNDALRTALAQRELLKAQTGFTDAGTRGRDVDTETATANLNAIEALRNAPGGFNEFVAARPEGMNPNAYQRSVLAPLGIQPGTTLQDIVSGALNEADPVVANRLGIEALMVGQDLSPGATSLLNFKDSREARAQANRHFQGNLIFGLYNAAGNQQKAVYDAIQSGDYAAALGAVTNEPNSRYQAAAAVMNALGGLMNSRASFAAAMQSGQGASLEFAIKAHEAATELVGRATDLADKLPDRKDEYEDIMKRARALMARSNVEYAKATGIVLPDPPEDLNQEGQVQQWIRDSFNLDFGLTPGTTLGLPTTPTTPPINGSARTSASGTRTTPAGVDTSGLDPEDAAIVDLFNGDTPNLDQEVPGTTDAPNPVTDPRVSNSMAEIDTQQRILITDMANRGEIDVATWKNLMGMSPMERSIALTNLAVTRVGVPPGQGPGTQTTRMGGGGLFGLSEADVPLPVVPPARPSTPTIPLARGRGN